MTQLRQALLDDRDSIRNLFLSAFPEAERELVAGLAVSLLNETYSLTLLAEENGMILGAICFSPVSLDSSDTFVGSILAPLGVHPDFQKRGIGSRLIDTGIERLKELDVDHLFVYGDPAYYVKFGFEAETAAPFTPPYSLQFPFGWQALSLKPKQSRPEAGTISCVEPLMNPVLW